MNIKSIKQWDELNTERPVIISGPCSAESETQVMETAMALKEMNISIFRAGIWKPRTRPNAFEGVGNIGLEWLKEVKRETGMHCAVEVANVKHVYQALKAGIDILWIGARTSVNPFAVQEIADALKGVDIPIMVKNPMNPDLNLWIGAIERLHQAGITKIAAIHRGFSSYEQSKYRNIPQWQIPIELKKRIPELSIICDPSHIAGKRSLLAELSQKAMDLNFDGLMIESHLNPAQAWSDAAQQLTPGALKKLLDELVLRNTKSEDMLLNGLEDLRHKIDLFDGELLSLLEKRMQSAAAIGAYKKEHQMSILQNDRWHHILENRMCEGQKMGLSKEVIGSIFEAIHQESIHKQKVLLKNNKQV